MFLGQKGDVLRTINTYTVAFTICGIATELIKNYVGYLRPIFFDKCNPDENYETCLGDSEHEIFDITEVQKSFISGHASFAFCGGVLFSLFLERTIGISSVQAAVVRQTPDSLDGTTSYVSMAYTKPPGLRKLGSILALAPMGVSIWVACSRVVDNVHFPADIVGGALLGASIALYCNPLW